MSTLHYMANHVGCNKEIWSLYLVYTDLKQRIGVAIASSTGIPMPTTIIDKADDPLGGMTSVCTHVNALESSIQTRTHHKSHEK